MQHRLQELFALYLNKTATPAELKELGELLSNTAAEEKTGLLAYAWENEPTTENVVFNTTETTAQLARILPEQTKTETGKLVLLSGKSVFKTVAAAVILLLIGTGVYFFFGKEKQENDKGSVVVKKAKTLTGPGAQGAVLTLNDGTELVLDSAGNGVLAEQVGVSVVKKADGLVYQPGNAASGTELLYNTMSTPRGRQYALSFSDGSKVWLNSSTRLRFPAVFSGNERVVELEGEAYFEVAHDAARPFIVKLVSSTGTGSSIKVLGTRFNVQSYNDEPVIQTTLLQGAVQFSNGKELVTLKPGQQSVQQTTGTGKKVTVRNADVSEAVAWKNGYFQFVNADLKTVMRQLSRWYDLDIVYEGELPALNFKGKIQRDLNLEDVLEILKADVNIKIEDRKIIVTPR